MLLAQLNQNFESGHERRDLGESRAGHHGRVEAHRTGVVRVLQMRDELM